jgi:cell division protein ZapA
MSDSVEVSVHGQVFKLRTEASPEYVKDLSDYVNGIMDRMVRQSRTPSTDRIAVMAALRIADALFQAREQAQEVANSMDARIRALIDATDRLLAES